MQKLANFIVNKRVLLFIVTISLAVLCGILTTLVPVNTDMAKYLADDSNMRQGLSIMETWFPDSDEESSFRVMFDDLSGSEVERVKAGLEAIPYVSSVDYEAGSESYNKENHTLYIVNTKCEYGTDEELSIQSALESDFQAYKMQYSSNNIKASTVPLGLIALALAVMLIVLFIMSESWLEPVLYMATIGIAVVINLGTNIIFPYTAEITVSMGPILQLALSMDYSIMLMNRYRQECAVCGDKTEAMKTALGKSVTSVASSCITTVVGLLTLVFLSFKLGPELGIVLAKGVLISMLCVFIILPFLVLKFDDAITRSRKKYPHIRMGFLAKVSYKARFVMPLIFLALFATFAVLQSNTGISFTEGNPDAVAEVFPKDNTIILIYNNDDEEGASEILSLLEDNDRITGMVGYHNTLGDERTAEDMSTAIASMSDGVKIDEDMIKLLYYLYYSGKLPSLTPEEFIAFIKNDVLSNDLLSEYLDDGMSENIDYLDKFGNRETLTKEMSAEEMADFFGIDSDDINSLYLYYYVENGGTEVGTMSVSDFADFVINDVAENDTYAEMFDSETMEQLEVLRTYTDISEMTKKRSYWDTAELIGMDESSAKLLYVYYFAQSDKYEPSSLTLSEFISFMQNDIAGNEQFSDYIDDAALEQLDFLSTLTDKEYLQSQLSAPELAAALGIDTPMAELVYAYYGVIKSPETSEYLSRELSPQELADELGITIEVATKLFELSGNTDGTMSFSDAINLILFNEAAQDALGSEEYARLSLELWNYLPELSESFSTTMSIVEFVDFVTTDETLKPMLGAENLSELEMLQTIIGYVLDDTHLTCSDIADFAGMKEPDAKMLLTYNDAQDGDFEFRNYLSVQQVINFIMDNRSLFGDALGDSFGDLKKAQTLINAAVGNASYKPSELSRLLGMSRAQVEDIYLLYQSERGDTSSRKLSPQTFLTFAVNRVLPNETFSSYFDTSTAEELKGGKLLVDAVVSGKALGVNKMYELISGFTDEISTGNVEMLYLYYAGIHSSDDSMTMNIPDMFNYLCDEVVNDSRFSDVFDRQTKEALRETQILLNDGLAQMKSTDYSRLVFTTDYPEESSETSEFIAELDSLRKTKLDKASYMAGSSVMVYEMENSFTHEFNIITLITAIAIFIVILISFRNIILSALLTLLVQGGVFITVAFIGFQGGSGGSMYYLALLIVQSILMGATIDYAIVLSGYYREYRATMNKVDALKAAYEGSIHTVATSGSILILATAVLGAFSTVAITAQVCSALSIGSLIAVLLILLVLPGMIVFLDRLVVKHRFTYTKPTQKSPKANRNSDTSLITAFKLNPKGRKYPADDLYIQ